MKIIRQPKSVTVKDTRLVFDMLNLKGRGSYSFPCDPHGEVDTLRLPLCARRNLRRCLAGTLPVGPGHVENYTYQYRLPRLGRCDCGERLELVNFTNTCDCGRDYNSSGQLLAPREQWGAETGEHWSACY